MTQASPMLLQGAQYIMVPPSGGAAAATGGRCGGEACSSAAPTCAGCSDLFGRLLIAGRATRGDGPADANPGCFVRFRADLCRLQEGGGAVVPGMLRRRRLLRLLLLGEGLRLSARAAPRAPLAVVWRVRCRVLRGGSSSTSASSNSNACSASILRSLRLSISAWIASCSGNQHIHTVSYSRCRKFYKALQPDDPQPHPQRIVVATLPLCAWGCHWWAEPRPGGLHTADFAPGPRHASRGQRGSSD
jgi:hypothetical protein